MAWSQHSEWTLHIPGQRGIHVWQPCAKCGLFATVALRLIFNGPIATFCLQKFAIIVSNILLISYKAHCVIWQIPWNNMRAMKRFLLARNVNLFDCQCKPWFKSLNCSAFYDRKYSNLPSQSPFLVHYKKISVFKCHVLDLNRKFLSWTYPWVVWDFFRGLYSGKSCCVVLPKNLTLCWKPEETIVSVHRKVSRFVSSMLKILYNTSFWPWWPTLIDL